jgi:hypothetical protein
MFTARIGGPGGDDAEFAAMPVAVAGEDLANVMVVTAKGATAVGRLTFDGGSKPVLTGVRVNAAPADMSDGPMMMGGSNAAAKADGTFELKGLAGQRLIRVANLPAGWMLKSVQLNGKDITDTGAEFKAGEQVTNLEVVATSKVTEINGAVTAANGDPMKDYTVVVFSDDPEHWALPMSRWVTGARPDQDGRFKVRSMPSGSYYVIALDYVEAGAWSDPELLERLKTRAKRLTLADGATETVDLKLADITP